MSRERKSKQAVLTAAPRLNRFSQNAKQSTNRRKNNLLIINDLFERTKKNKREK